MVSTAKRPIRPEMTISEKMFEESLKKRLGGYYPRALEVFKNYGQFLSYDVASVILLATMRGKNDVNTILDRLEAHWTGTLRLIPEQERLPERMEKFFGGLARLLE